MSGILLQQVVMISAAADCEWQGGYFHSDTDEIERSQKVEMWNTSVTIPTPQSLPLRAETGHL